jgi:undecaprenyl-diphosphatase
VSVDDRSRHSRGVRSLPAVQALVLGLVHGPTELLPVSSSAHTTLIPWLAGWSYEEFDPAVRKSFEVALHAGTAAALAIDRCAWPLRIAEGPIDVLLLAIVPPALAGYALEGPIERRLGTPISIVAGLLTGAGAMALADRRSGQRGFEQAGRLDGLMLGLAQALALAPGVSRSGATLAVARARSFEPDAARRLSWWVGAPVILGAGALRAQRLMRDGLASDCGVQLAVGAAGSFVSTLLAGRCLRHRRNDSLTGHAIYRTALAMVVAGTALRRSRRRG